MRLKYLALFLVCLLALITGCGKAVISGQGDNHGGSGSVGIPFFTSLNMPESHGQSAEAGGIGHAD